MTIPRVTARRVVSVFLIARIAVVVVVAAVGVPITVVFKLSFEFIAVLEVILIELTLFQLLFELSEVFHLLLDSMAGFLEPREVFNLIFFDNLLAKVSHSLQLFDFLLHVCFVFFFHLNCIRFFEVHFKLF